MKILCFGRLIADIITKSVKFPPPGTAVSAGELTVVPGGGAYFSSQIFSVFGHQVNVVATVGGDPLSSMILGTMHSQIELVRVMDGQQTPWSIVGVDESGSARYLLHRGVECELLESQLRLCEKLRPDILFIANATQLLAQSNNQLTKWIAELRSRNPEIVIAADMAKLGEISNLIWELAPELDYLFGNQFELSNATGEWTLSDIRRYCKIQGIRKAVVVKLGQLGSYYGSTANEEEFVSPGFTRPKIESEVGAGDVFSSAVVHWLVAGEAPLYAIEKANLLAASHVCREFDIHKAKSQVIEQIKNVDESRFARSETFVPTMNLYHQPESAGLKPIDFESARNLSAESLDYWVKLIRKHGNVASGSRLLDAGCGPGRFTYPLSHEVGCEIHAIDRDAEVLESAKEKCKQQTGCHWYLGDLATLPEPLKILRDEFDCVWLSSVIPHIEADDLAVVFSELHHVLKQNGRLLVRFTPAHLVERSQWFPYIPEARDYAKRRYKSLAQVLGFLLDTGFEIVSVELHRDSQMVDSVLELFDRWKRGGFSWSRYLVSPISDAVFERMRRNLGDGPIECWHDNFLVVAEKIRP